MAMRRYGKNTAFPAHRGDVASAEDDVGRASTR
jgi:hypothetical protein